MSLLSEEIDISLDSRRICGQNIEINEDNSEKRINVNEKCQMPIDENFDGHSQMSTSESLGPNIVKNINDFSPEIFQLILATFLKSNNFRDIMPFRRVCSNWLKNIDTYLSSKHGFQYTGSVTKGQPPEEMNYYEFNAMLSFFPNLKQIIINNFSVSDYMITILQHCCPKIERLNISGCRNISCNAITILTLRFSQLTFLDISHCDLDEIRFTILCKGLQKLKTINAINPGKEITARCLSKLGPEIDDIWIGLNHLLDPNPAIEALVSGNGKNLIHFGLIVNNYQKTKMNLITDNMLKLKSLKISFGSDGYGSLKDIGKLKELEFLVLAEDSCNENKSVLNDESLLPVFKGCNKLKSFAISATKAITCRFTHYSISQIPLYCPKMEQIRFLNGHNVLDETLIELANLKFIRVLQLASMAGVSNIGIINFLTKAQNTIRNFRVSDCPKVTEDIIDPIIEVAKLRPFEKIKVYIEDLSVSRCLDGLPSNLKIDIKQKSTL